MLRDSSKVSPFVLALGNFHGCGLEKRGNKGAMDLVDMHVCEHIHVYMCISKCMREREREKDLFT